MEKLRHIKNILFIAMMNRRHVKYIQSFYKKYWHFLHVKSFVFAINYEV